jgi:hypothetical protein
MRVKVKKILNKEKENTRTNEKYNYTSALCIFDDNETAKWVRVPDYVCAASEIKVNSFADVYFSDDAKTQASIFEPVAAADVMKPANIDFDTGEILEE